MCLRRAVLRRGRTHGSLRDMKSGLRGLGFLALVFVGLSWTGRTSAAEAPGKAMTAFEAYTGRVEARLAQQHRSARTFVADLEQENVEERLRQGDVVIEKLTPDKGEVPGGMLHDWRGTAFVNGGTAAGFERLMKNIGNYPLMYSPQVVKAQILSPKSGPASDHFAATMRVKQKHVITVVMDTAYDVTYGHLDSKHGYSTSRSTKIAEIDDAGTDKERAVPPEKEHGYLWRLNTYWSYEERDGGLYMQIESVSLTRGIPAGLGWAIGPFVESVPRESLEFTLSNTGKALAKQEGR